MIVPTLSAGAAVEARLGTGMLRRQPWACRVSVPSQFVRGAQTAKPESKSEPHSKPAAANSKRKNRRKAPPAPADLPPPLIEINQGAFYRTYPKPNEKTPPLFKKFDFSLSARVTPDFTPPPKKKPSKDKARNAMAQKRIDKLVAKDKHIQSFYGPFHWAVMGPGSTDFLDILRGQYIAVPPNSRSYPYLASENFSPSNPKLRHPSNAIQYVGFRGEGSQAAGGTRGAYLSARYESLSEETDWTVRQYLCNQMELNPLEDEDAQSSHIPYNQDQWDAILQRFQLSHLLDMPTAKLSNGQTRRTRIAKALLAQPELLLLDQPFMGLDPITSDSISSLLREVAFKSSPRVILALRAQDSIPEWISHVAIMNTDRIAFQGTKEEFFNVVDLIYKGLRPWKKEVLTLGPLLKEGGVLHGYRELLVKDYPDQFPPDPPVSSEQQSDQQLQTGEAGSKSTIPISMDGEPQIEMNGVRVQYGDKVVLGDWLQIESTTPGLHWKVRRGQRWAILGANGSGKTTLLSLITSDHPQAYALPVRLFGRSRLPEPPKPGISIFDLQARIGHSSPEIQAFFPPHLTIREAIESVWADTFLSKPKLNFEIDKLIDRVLAHFRTDLVKPRQLQPTKENEIDMSIIPSGVLQRFATPPRQSANETDEADSESSYDNMNLPVGFDTYAYADEMTFGQLDVAQQRLVLFIRAIIKKQEVIVLDEAFSAMPPTMRQKCFALLEGPPPAAEGQESEQLPYVDETQSVIFVSHQRQEIPDSVRFWMRLPSQVGDDQQLNFAMGVLPDGETLASSNELWQNLWSKNSFPPYEQKNSSAGEQTPNDAEVYGYVLAKANNGKVL
ncbi:putative ABC transporter ATP-binding protein C323,04 [Talaromyces islandicus]|uniref:Putative ABC transporter ATP-binding protein C323,04 n=1 Tax=Talaromyces islandicus TaxID=28573 RepID=A0A0U1LV94_TALIS|nr:putative ABC transporter ATP-binding protein C323,04 [Talaromyces islandicus]